MKRFVLALLLLLPLSGFAEQQVVEINISGLT